MSSRSNLAVIDHAPLVGAQAVEWYEIEETARRLYAPKADDAEWALFLLEARTLDLSPARGEILALAIGQEKVGDTWRDKYSSYVTIHGVRAMAMRTGLMDGADGPYWCGPDGDMKSVWLDFENPPVASRFTVFLKGQDRGYSGVCTMKRAKTYVDRKDGNRVKLTKTWREIPEIMLAVRAEMDAYRRAGLLQRPELLERAIVTYASGELVDLVDDQEERSRTGRRLHAIAGGRGADHDGARAAVQHDDPSIQSLSEADTLLMANTADQLDVYDADGVAYLTGMDPQDVTGEPYEVAPEPDADAETITTTGTRQVTAQQIRWLSDNWRSDLPAADYTTQEQAWITGEAAPTWAQADKLIKKMAGINAAADAGQQ